MKRGLLIILSGPSGVGKHTLWIDLLKETQLRLAYSISMTTRVKRFNEKNGREYFFVTRKIFESAIKKGKMLEYAQYCNHYYGTPKSYVEKLRHKGMNVLLEIDAQGGINLIKQFKNIDQGLVSIFVLPPSTEHLIKRLCSRGTEDKKTIDYRIKQAKWEIKQAKHYDYKIINDKISVAKKQLKSILINAIKKNAN